MAISDLPRAFARWFALRDQLTDARRATGWNQDQLAARAGVSGRCTVGRIERGQAIPGVETFVAMAHALGLEPVLVPAAAVRLATLSEEDLWAIVTAADVAVGALPMPTPVRMRAEGALRRLRTSEGLSQGQVA